MKMIVFLLLALASYTRAWPFAPKAADTPMQVVPSLGYTRCPDGAAPIAGPQGPLPCSPETQCPQTHECVNKGAPAGICCPRGYNGTEGTPNGQPPQPPLINVPCPPPPVPTKEQIEAGCQFVARNASTGCSDVYDLICASPTISGTVHPIPVVPLPSDTNRPSDSNATTGSVLPSAVEGLDNGTVASSGSPASGQAISPSGTPENGSIGAPLNGSAISSGIPESSTLASSSAVTGQIDSNASRAVGMGVESGASGVPLENPVVNVSAPSVIEMGITANSSDLVAMNGVNATAQLNVTESETGSGVNGSITGIGPFPLFPVAAVTGDGNESTTVGPSSAGVELGNASSPSTAANTTTLGSTGEGALSNSSNPDVSSASTSAPASTSGSNITEGVFTPVVPGFSQPDNNVSATSPGEFSGAAINESHSTIEPGQGAQNGSNTPLSTEGSGLNETGTMSSTMTAPATNSATAEPLPVNGTAPETFLSNSSVPTLVTESTPPAPMLPSVDEFGQSHTIPPTVIGAYDNSTATSPEGGHFPSRPTESNGTVENESGPSSGCPPDSLLCSLPSTQGPSPNPNATADIGMNGNGTSELVPNAPSEPQLPATTSLFPQPPGTPDSGTPLLNPLAANATTGLPFGGVAPIGGSDSAFGLNTTGSTPASLEPAPVISPEPVASGRNESIEMLSTTVGTPFTFEASPVNNAAGNESTSTQTVARATGSSEFNGSTPTSGTSLLNGSDTSELPLDAMSTIPSSSLPESSTGLPLVEAVNASGLQNSSVDISGASRVENGTAYPSFIQSSVPVGLPDMSNASMPTTGVVPLGNSNVSESIDSNHKNTTGIDEMTWDSMFGIASSMKQIPDAVTFRKSSGPAVATSGQFVPCQRNADCYNLREPAEWCQRDQPSFLWTDKSCFCAADTEVQSCIIERLDMTTGQLQWTFCAPDTQFDCDNGVRRRVKQRS